MSRRRQQRKTEKAKRHAPSAPKPSRSVGTVVRHAMDVERLAYTRAQAAEALGVSRSTFSRRVLPLLETVDMPWGPRLVPVDELERFVKERRRPARGRAQTAPPGRPTVVPDELVLHIQAERAKDKSLRQIARDLNASQTPTAHGGAQWWPSTVRAVLGRASVTTESARRDVEALPALAAFVADQDGSDEAPEDVDLWRQSEL